MKKICICFLLLVSSSSFGQVNLVPNFSFEQYDSCPNMPDQIKNSIGWKKYSGTLSTPDYYNSCASVGAFNVPYSHNGYQQDHRNCGAFAGLVTYCPVINYREHIGIKLSNPLVIGQKYFISFYAVMAEVIYTDNYHRGMPSNKIGMRLSTVAYNMNNPCPIDNFAQLYSASVIDDSVNWQRITGSIIADSAYKYIIVGNFFDDAHTDTMHYNCDSCLNTLSYYYVDDICLSTDSLLCNGGIDNILCTVGIGENVSEDNVSVHPNPASDFIAISFDKSQDAEIRLVDLLGNTILTSEVINKKECSINVSAVAAGCYFLQIVYKRTGTTTTKKIMII